MPLIPANMDTVISCEMAEIIISNGGIPIFHRFAPLETQMEWVQTYGDKVFISAGLTNKDTTTKLLDEGPLGVCIDIAHGHDERVVAYIKELRDNYGDLQIIAGNVCTRNGYLDLVNAGANAVKCGIGNGAACSTRIVTGFGCPQFSALQECAAEARKMGIPIIADGGIRMSSDIVKALAAGASTVMCGKLFAECTESAGTKMVNIPFTAAKQVGSARREEL